jgi:hypothetical protein
LRTLAARFGIAALDAAPTSHTRALSPPSAPKATNRPACPGRAVNATRSSAVTPALEPGATCGLPISDLEAGSNGCTRMPGSSQPERVWTQATQTWPVAESTARAGLEAVQLPDVASGTPEFPVPLPTYSRASDRPGAAVTSAPPGASTAVG